MMRAARAASRIGLIAIALLLLGQLTIVAWSHGQAFWRGHLDASHWLEYESVNYKGSGPGELTMESISVLHRPVDVVVWNDVLRCTTGSGDTAIYTTQTTRSIAPPTHTLKATDWAYTAGHPTDGRSCVMVSTISFEVEGTTKSVRNTSDPFTP